ncbi:CTB family bacteriocin [Nostoc sp. 2RC]|jgi:hypothetical protein|uniref:CTB family bacteriocin n=1 Tax=Nostoc sp. 2RC TaxID=2485484 RepID=UPI001626DF32|nr:CTB family bacteriocin [Nostoc sp. 2RC]MBC1241930.1 hypothetical protein [Nostoc sp. 2RC]
MSYPIIASELLLDLSDEQQQLLAGGVDSENSRSIYGQSQGFIQGTTSSGPQGSSSNSLANKSRLITGAQDTLNLGGEGVPRLLRRFAR